MVKMRKKKLEVGLRGLDMASFRRIKEGLVGVEVLKGGVRRLRYFAFMLE